MLALLIENRRKPRFRAIEVWYEKDTIERGFKRWHVRLINQRPSGWLRWVERNTANGVEATVEFFDNGSVQSGPQIHAIWTERPRPLRDDLVVEAHRGDLTAGRPGNILVAFKHKGQKTAHQFDEKNYRPDGSFGSVESRNLPEGTYAVRLTLHYGGERHPFWFRLDNREDELGTFVMDGPYGGNPLNPRKKFQLPELP